MKKTCPRGFTLAELLVVLLVLFALGATVWYFVSPVFSARVGTTVREKKDWGSDNIHKYPVEYLEWALAEAAKWDQDVRGRCLGLKINKNATERALEECSSEKSDCETLLAECKDAYGTAASSDKWPVTVGHFTFGETALKHKIVELSREIKRASSLAEDQTANAKLIDDDLLKAQDLLENVLKLKADLTTNLELARTNRLTEGIDSVRDRVNAMLDVVKAQRSMPDGPPNNEEMRKASGDDRYNDEFKKIMGK
jgi:prepilin-type N-terminal cleavage/methylation domain-containing protein